MPQPLLLNKHPKKKIPLDKLKGLATRLCTVLNFRKGEIAFLLTTNRSIQKYHSRFLGKNQTTDVITFSESNTVDIVISLDRAASQARLRGLHLFDEVALLMCHGLLHAKGFDDRTEKKWLTMRKQEFEWMTKIL